MTHVLPEVTARFAVHVAQIGWDDLPADVGHAAKRAVLNYFAVALAGCRDRTLDIAAQTLMRFSGSATATVIGRDVQADMPTAAALNAMAANVFDFDDTHLPTIIHPTAPVASALFALAQERPVSGQQWLTAFVLGVDVACRLGNAVTPFHYARGWHITSTCGVVGAAAGAAKLMGLDEQRTRWAMGSAANQACGLVETLGTMAKSTSVGNAARNGLLSALLAESGFDGPEHPLEGARGFLNVYGGPPDGVEALRDLGQHWALMANTYKPYPCGVVLNPVIDACLELAASKAWPTRLARIDAIELTGHPLLRQRTDRPGVSTGRASQVSAQHAVAVALTRGRAGLPEFSDAAVADPVLRALGQKVVFKDDASFTVDGVALRVLLDDGSEIATRIDAARGSLGRPLTDGELENKLHDLSAFGGSGCEPAALIDAVWRLDSASDVQSVLALAAGRPRT